MSRELEIIELIQIFKLKKQGIDKYNDRYNALISKYSTDDIAEYSLSTSVLIADEMGLLRQQKCTNTKCKKTFISEDISGLCDYCYQPTLRLLND